MVLEVEPGFLEKQVKKLAKEIAEEVAKKLRTPPKRTQANRASARKKRK